ncbi:Aste57867_24863 [Aphanomyces stellatus]|uniref:Aste57867_24863 protein n=1 Tax=Aphanomyces stellatus TaxID=120398 RepID=A0A485LVU7_9STRA|nr:hypothetical protein As57867_024785 [Aphanomyces stellatus]VFU01497.1 Aste57867_24863 [Aphanomyces stellatus]
MATESTPLLGQATARKEFHRWTMFLMIALAGSLLLASISMPLAKSSVQPFDVIVVGGGPAGSVLAARLVETTNLSVLLIEAGDASQRSIGGTHFITVGNQSTNRTPFDVPFYWGHVAHMEAFHWNVPNVFVAKALGGCGIHNAMLYGNILLIHTCQTGKVRALPGDIRSWNMAPTWTWGVAQDIYLTTETFDGPANLSHHGYNGRVRTTRPRTMESTSQAFLNGCVEIGLTYSADFNAPNGRLGAGWYDFNIRDGVRDSAAAAFLSPLLASTHPTFQLLLNTLVEKVNFDSNGRAISVDIRQSHGQSSTVHASRAIVLAAGAIHTPKLLTLSGIGPKDVLQNLGIPVVANLPLVGSNLQDHPAIAMTFQAKEPVDINMTTAWTQYLVSNEGWLATPGIAAGAFLIPPGATTPQLQLTFFPRETEPQWSTVTPQNQVLVTIALLAPEARNRVEVTSNQIDTPVQVASEIPQSTSEHLTPNDAHKLVYGIQAVRQIAKSLAMSAVVGSEIMPGDRNSAKDDDLLSWVYASVYRNSHWVGSAKMGTTPSDGVVDARLRVMNVSNLYVADASVIPIIPNGNVHSTVVMVASRAATLLADDLQNT